MAEDHNPYQIPLTKTTTTTIIDVDDNYILFNHLRHVVLFTLKSRKYVYRNFLIVSEHLNTQTIPEKRIICYMGSQDTFVQNLFLLYQIKPLFCRGSEIAIWKSKTVDLG